MSKIQQGKDFDMYRPLHKTIFDKLYPIAFKLIKKENKRMEVGASVISALGGMLESVKQHPGHTAFDAVSVEVLEFIQSTAFEFVMDRALVDFRYPSLKLTEAHVISVAEIKFFTDSVDIVAEDLASIH